MPQIDGLEVIRQTKAAGIACRFLILSGYDDFYLAQKAIRYGANGYFLKPLKIEEFKDELSRQYAEILSHHNSYAAARNLDELMESSKIFFLNQLLLNEIRDESEIERRRTMLSLTLFDTPYRVIVCSAVISNDRLLPALKQAKSLFISAFSNQSIEAWILREKQLVLLISDAQNKELCAIRKPIASILCYLKDQTGIRFYAAVSTLTDRAAQASAAYTDALRALSYHIYECENDVYDDTMVCRQKPSFSPSSIAYDPMIACIERNDPDEIKRCCAQFVHSLFFTLQTLRRHLKVHFLLSQHGSLIFAEQLNLATNFREYGDAKMMIISNLTVIFKIHFTICVYLAHLFALL